MFEKSGKERYPNALNWKSGDRRRVSKAYWLPHKLNCDWRMPGRYDVIEYCVVVGDDPYWVEESWGDCGYRRDHP